VIDTQPVGNSTKVLTPNACERNSIHTWYCHE